MGLGAGVRGMFCTFLCNLLYITTSKQKLRKKIFQKVLLFVNKKCMRNVSHTF